MPELIEHFRGKGSIAVVIARHSVLATEELHDPPSP